MGLPGEEITSFDLLESPLEGTNLIEASAGTGKTYTLTCLFLRLVLEKRLPVKDILVVTYTVAATEELRDRIRRRLREALEAYAAGDSRDVFLKGVLHQVPDAEDASGLLRAALRDFDEASIFTIHGFCQRTLHESAFESGSLFDTELKPEQETGLVEEIVQDFWRRHFYNAPFELVSYALAKKYGPAFFLKLLREGITSLDVKIIPETAPVEAIRTEPFYRAYGEMKKAWPGARAGVEEKLGAPALYAEYGKNLQAYLAMMDDFVAGSMAVFPLPEKLEKFTTRELERKTKKGMSPPSHPFFALVDGMRAAGEALQAEMDQQLLFLKGEIFRYLRQELPGRKQSRNIQSFNDLLTRLRDSLEKTGGDELSRSIRNRYRAALVDEFQDTDPVQYAIFQNVFGRDALLFLIGDPKQAIYSFRGADLFAYIKAAGRVDCRYTLSGNWRSEPRLIEAVNTLFENGPNPFLVEEIEFKKATAQEGKKYEILTINGASGPPFHLWYVDSGRVSEGKWIGKGVAYDLIARALAAEISRLVTLGRRGKALLGSQPLVEEQIAVLVRTNRQARIVQEALAELKIPSVLYSTGNLFDSPEAMEVCRLLRGIASPHQERLLRAALATEIMGVDGETLETLSRDEAGWEEWLSRFREYYELWSRRGFIEMFRYFLMKEGVRSRLLSLPNGERRLTNVLHLSEVLHQAAIEEKLGMTGLVKWLARQRDPGSPRLEEHQLRLESDAYAVKVVTIHKSKGLEYPVVFCPFHWSKSRVDKDAVFTFHDEEDDWRLNLELDPENSLHRASAAREELAEDMRLLYVSLTRAKSRCYLVWGRFREAETSALAYLLHPPARGEENIVGAAAKNFKDKVDEEIREELEALAGRSDGAIRFCDMPTTAGKELLPPEETKEELTGKEFCTLVSMEWQVASFSGLSAAFRESEDSSASTDTPDHDQVAWREEPVLAEEPFSIFSFPKGTKAGSLLHEIFESLDFTETDPMAAKQLVDRKLREYGLGKEWQETVWQMIARVLAVPLGPRGNGVTLSRVARKDRLNELEFYFPLQAVAPQKLSKVFTEHGGPAISAAFPRRIEALNFQPARGFMKGYMDLVFQLNGRFYLVDWKSNFLGSRVEDYGRARMAREMEENFYCLQADLYALALHQYLKKRLPGYRYGEHFGGVFYIFLRGVDPRAGDEFGVYSALPGEGLVEALSQNLIAPPGGIG